MTEKFYELINQPVGSTLSEPDRKKFNDWVFKEMFFPNMEKSEKSGFKINISKSELDFLKGFSSEKTVKNDLEFGKIDDKKRSSRNLTGAVVEFAFLKKFGKQDLFDDQVVSESRKKCHPDLVENLNVFCDIKGSQLGNVPIVFTKDRSYVFNKKYKYHCPNIIGVTNYEYVWLLGIATPEILHKYCDLNLLKIANPYKKSGFYGVNYLHPIMDSIEKLSKFCLDNMNVISKNS